MGQFPWALQAEHRRDSGEMQNTFNVAQEAISRIENLDRAKLNAPFDCGLFFMHLARFHAGLPSAS